jgi:hypothetical protein
MRVVELEPDAAHCCSAASATDAAISTARPFTSLALPDLVSSLTDSPWLKCNPIIVFTTAVFLRLPLRFL